MHHSVVPLPQGDPDVGAVYCSEIGDVTDDPDAARSVLLPEGVAGGGAPVLLPNKVLKFVKLRSTASQPAV
jgi:hypothetical protein